MRFAAFALMACLSGCSLSPGDGAECTTDTQCGEDVCARTGECLPKSTFTLRNSTVAFNTTSSTFRCKVYLPLSRAIT